MDSSSQSPGKPTIGLSSEGSFRTALLAVDEAFAILEKELEEMINNPSTQKTISPGGYETKN
jgi:hypothetical protein